MEIPSDGGKRTIIERVLKLRRCMGVTNELSTVDPRDEIFLQSHVESSERSTSVRSVYDRRQWYTFKEDLDGPSNE